MLKTNGKLLSYRNDVGKIVVDEENNVIFEGNKSSVELGKLPMRSLRQRVLEILEFLT